jgi:hypothetical protein
MFYRRGQMEEEYDESFGVDREEANIEDGGYDQVVEDDEVPESEDDLDEMDGPADLVDELEEDREWEAGEDEYSY